MRLSSTLVELYTGRIFATGLNTTLTTFMNDCSSHCVSYSITFTWSVKGNVPFAFDLFKGRCGVAGTVSRFNATFILISG
ncbi:hypothetical protein PR048_009636 [Dryococelus australis]|uniref:Uncharacterized protein n=1 Tax=Dryococelus australis TaxID=614101 RepID=A0ABQ9I0I0_9NEOP|nr:hypothetical protein PR048_009636 [Dryococelus australis]